MGGAAILAHLFFQRLVRVVGNAELRCLEAAGPTLMALVPDISPVKSAGRLSICHALGLQLNL